MHSSLCARLLSPLRKSTRGRKKVSNARVSAISCFFSLEKDLTVLFIFSLEFPTCGFPAGRPYTLVVQILSSCPDSVNCPGPPNHPLPTTVPVSFKYPPSLKSVQYHLGYPDTLLSFILFHLYLIWEYSWLQCCVNFRCTTKWFSFTYICIYTYSLCYIVGPCWLSILLYSSAYIQVHSKLANYPSPHTVPPW